MAVKSCNHALVAYHETQVKPHIHNILKKNNLAYRTFDLRRRRKPGVVESHEAALETLLIDTPSKDPTVWKVALMEFANLYYVGGYGPRDIEVEILNSREVHCNISHVLEDNPELLEALHHIRPAIIEEVRRLCPNGWSSVAFHRRSRLGAWQEKAGTLGGWLIWNRPGHPAVTVGLTCYHLLAGSAAKEPEIVYPAAMDLHHSIKKLKEKTAQPGCRPEDLDTLKKLQLMVRNAPIGRVVATSDNRLNAAGRRMDWALIQMVGDKARNCPPSPADLHSTAVFTKRGKVYYAVTQDSLISRFGAMEQNAWVAKNGRTSVVTAGEVNCMTRIVSWRDENIQSDEVEVFGLSTDFVHYGDSGSFVVDCHGALVGLIIGMDSSPSAFGLANSRRDLSAANGHNESPRSRVVDSSFRATLAPS